MVRSIVSRLRFIAGAAFIAFSGVSVLLVAIAMTREVVSSGPPPALIWSYVIVPVSWLAVVFVHEAGHALAALATGWRVIVFAVGPITWQVHNRQLAFGGPMLHPDAGGYVMPVPGSPAVHTRTRNAWISAGGPLASLAFGLAMLACTANAPPLARLVTGTLGGLSLLAFAMTVIPSKLGKSGNDALHLVQLYRKPWSQDGARWANWIQALLNYNVRLRDVPAWMHALSRTSATHAEACAQLYDGREIARTLDAAEVDAPRARVLIEAYRAAYGNNDWLAACDACLAAIHEGDAERAAAALAASEGSLSGHELALAAEAAIAARRGQAERAATKLDDMDAVLKKTSPLKDFTFADIRHRIEAVSAEVAASRAALRDLYPGPWTDRGS